MASGRCGKGLESPSGASGRWGLAKPCAGGKWPVLMLAGLLLASAMAETCLAQTTRPAGSGSSGLKSTTQPARTQEASKAQSGALEPRPAVGRGAPAAKKRTGKGAAGEKPPWEKDADGELLGPLWTMLASVVVILALGGVGIFVVRKVLPRIGTSAGKRIFVVESAHLGPRQTVHLLQIGDQRFLVASTRERISMLAEVARDAERPHPHLAVGDLEEETDQG